MSEHTGGDGARRARWRRALLDKGAAVAGALEDLLADREVDLATLGLGERGSDLIERTRAHLQRLDRAIKAFDTPSFGRCGVCGEALQPEALDEQPWADRCARHADA